MVSTPVMLPVPDPSPATFALAFAAHAYDTLVKPFDTSPLSNVIDRASSEHAVAVPAIPTGSGFTVTVTVNVDPEHNPDVGVTV